MIVRTKYRKLSLKEVRDHFLDPWKPDQKTWELLAGYPVRIETPGEPNRTIQPSFKCDGPLYKIVDYAGWVCPHIAEIGD